MPYLSSFNWLVINDEINAFVSSGDDALSFKVWITLLLVFPVVPCTLCVGLFGGTVVGAAVAVNWFFFFNSAKIFLSWSSSLLNASVYKICIISYYN